MVYNLSLSHSPILIIMYKSLLVCILLSVFYPAALLAQGLQLYGLQYVLPQSPLSSDFELVKINPLTAQGTALYTIPQTKGVESASSVFNPSTRRYQFWGTNDDGDARFYSAATDTPLWQDTMAGAERPIEVQYDLQAGETYGLLPDETGEGIAFVSVNPQTGAYTLISLLPSIRFIEVGTSTFDANHHRYFFLGIDASNFAKRLYSLDARTGAILQASDPLSASRHIRTLQYDLNSDKLLALYATPDGSRPNDPVTGLPYYSTYLAEVDSVNGGVSLISTSPVLSGYQAIVIQGSSDFDQLSRILVAAVVNETGIRRMLLIQGSDGSLILDKPFPQNIYELKCDNESYAEQAYQGTTSLPAVAQLSVRCYPNPATDWVQIERAAPATAGTLRLLDAQGRIRQELPLAPGQQTLRCSLQALPAGVYLLYVQQEGHQPTTQRLVKR
jgi:hypothetical protein